ncbi:unnamed protein product [Schistocephalus solidus]|uniref:Uncharacterized protein n=1 Tax=Schistocephalus solidus TaxID=70667 RepID=A0A183T9P4_SCHSO|nr:unnamed protein product [Schistocephalus solidus]
MTGSRFQSDKYIAQAQHDADILGTERHRLLLTIGKYTQVVFRLASQIKAIVVSNASDRPVAAETSVVDSSFLQSLLDCFDVKVKEDETKIRQFEEREEEEEEEEEKEASKLVMHLLKSLRADPFRGKTTFEASVSANSYWGKFSLRNSDWSHVLGQSPFEVC